MWLRAALVWGLLMIAAILNGGFRLAVLIPRLGERAGHIVSTVMLSVWIGALTWWRIVWIHPFDPSEAMQVGLLWLAMTLLFEFGFGHYVARKPWAALLADYNVRAGRIWMLVLLTTALAPLLTARARLLW